MPHTFTNRIRIIGKRSELDPENTPEMLEWRRKAFEGGYWSKFVSLHPRPYRLRVFVEVMGRMGDA
jgi:hypothetical protein